MNLYEYVITGDPKTLLATWSRITEAIGKEELLFNVVTERSDGITVLDVCPSEQDFQGWINGDDWRRAKAELGGDVVVRPLGEVRGAVARDGLVEITPAHVHAAH
jgi:hypothetical protein